MTKQKLEQIRDAIAILSNLSNEDWEELYALIEEPEYALKLSKVETNEDVIQKVTLCLKELGIPNHLSGYTYLLRAIACAMKEKDYTQIRMCKDLYPKVAKELGISVASVENGIRNVIEIAWNEKRNTNLYSVVFGDKIKTCKPSNGKVIKSVVEYLKFN